VNQDQPTPGTTQYDCDGSVRVQMKVQCDPKFPEGPFLVTLEVWPLPSQTTAVVFANTMRQLSGRLLEEMGITEPTEPTHDAPPTVN